MLQQVEAGDESAAVGELSYLRDAARLQAVTCSATTAAEMRDARMLVDGFHRRALFALAAVAQRLLHLLAAGSPMAAAWNAVQVDQHNAVHAHVMAILLSHFVAGAFAEQNALCAAAGWAGLAPVLRKLALLFALRHLLDSPDFLEAAFLAPAQLPLAREAVRELEGELAGEAVGLVDAFWYSDLQLASAIGRHDGQAYLALLEATARSDLNAAEPVASYASSLRPILRAKL